MEKLVKRSWVEINTSQIRENLGIIRSVMPIGAKIMAVIKADAYGHGDVEIAKILLEEGVLDFAVSNIDEACRLRSAGIKGQILIFGYTPIEEVEKLIEYDITQTIISEEYAEKIASTKKSVKCQFAIDTGMNRIGLNASDVKYCDKLIRKYGEEINIVGIYTHLCVADSANEADIEFTKEQIKKFMKIVDSVSDLKLPNIHCLNSAGLLWYMNLGGEMARLGIALYGLKPSYEKEVPIDIKGVLSWKSVVSMVKDIYKDETVGYGRTYTANRNMKIATISTGYADGYSRLLSNKGFVLIEGCKAPIIGNICMDQFMVDVTGIEGVKMGTEVILIGSSGTEKITADDMAKMVGTIGYEIVCNISKRVTRIYT